MNLTCCFFTCIYNLSPDILLLVISESSPMTISDKKTYDRTQNVIEMMVDAYQAMCERRRLIYCPRSLKDLLGGTQPV